ncbi:MAG: PAS domain-containing protein, partial [Flavobacteriales bacterium]
KRTSNLVIITDTTKRITWVNESVCSITGYSKEDLLGKTPRIFQGPLSDSNTIAFINANLDQKKSVSAEIINYDKKGIPYWIALNIEPLFENNKLTGYMAVETEISEKKKLELEQKNTISKLEETRKQISQINVDLEKTIEEKTKSIKNLALIPQHNPNPVMELNIIEQKISYFNYAAENYLGEVLNYTFHDLLKLLKIDHQGQLINTSDRENKIGQKIFEITTFIVEGDSLCRVYLHDITLRKENEIQLSLLIEQLKSTETALVKKTQQLEDSLLELEKAQSDLLNKERLSTLGVLIAGIAHEINSPLGAIKASGENLEQLFQDSFEDIIWQLSPNEILHALTLFRQRKVMNLTTKEERERVQRMNGNLQDIVRTDIDRLNSARALVQMGIEELTPTITEILKDPKFKPIIRLALNFS